MHLFPAPSLSRPKLPVPPNAPKLRIKLFELFALRVSWLCCSWLPHPCWHYHIMQFSSVSAAAAASTFHSTTALPHRMYHICFHSYIRNFCWTCLPLICLRTAQPGANNNSQEEDTGSTCRGTCNTKARAQGIAARVQVNAALLFVYICFYSWLFNVSAQNSVAI